MNQKLLKMKKLLLTLGIVLLISSTLLAQAPQSFKYQAIARDIDGSIIANQQVSVKINLIQGSENGNVVYSEFHNLQTNQYGLINLEIGMGEDKMGNFSSW